MMAKFALRAPVAKRMTWAAMSWLTIIGLLVGAYTAFVAMCMWNWFAVQALNMPVVSFPVMLGLIWLIGILIPQSHEGVIKWDSLLTALETCLPDDKRTILSESLQEQMTNIWVYVLPMTFGKIFADTVVLVLGFGLYVFIQ